MALIQKRSRRTTLLLIILGVIALAGIGYWLIPKFLSSDNTATTSEAGIKDLKIVQDFGEEVFRDPRFTALRTYGQPLPEIDLNKAGRINPFAPLQ